MSLGLCGVILAAGESSRMGRDKALLPWPKPLQPVNPTALPPTTILSSAIEALSDVCDLVIVVAGANQNVLRPVVEASGETLVVNPDPKRGQFSSLQVGLQAVLDRGRDNAIITLVDRPPPRPGTLTALVEAFARKEHRVWAVVPEYRDKHGHPIVIGREMVEALLRAPAESNAREIEHANQSHISYIAINDPLVTTNIDTPQDYVSLESR
jgi:molybdenum cofactor cytidylyltransferase